MELFMSEKPIKADWAPPKQYHQVESALPGVEVFAPIPKTVKPDSPTSFSCPNCGANTAYDVAAGGIACEYCGYVAPVHTVHVGQTAAEYEFTLDTVSQAERGWGEKRQVLHCESCGAELSIPYGALTSTCPYCASNHVNVTISLEEDLRPRFLIPFKLDKAQSKQQVVEWLGKGWFHPDDLAANTVVGRLSGVYLPFWTFDTEVDAAWKAEVGHEHTVRHYNASQKRWETRTKIVWRWETGDIHLSIDDFLVTGSSARRISLRILRRISNFVMSGLETYDPSYLAGWQAQAYETTLTEAWETGKESIREQAKKACYQDIHSTHVRNFSMSADFADESWRYVLLPVYLAAYHSGEETYQVMVNGQTGTVAGQKPVAWWKIWLAVGAMLAPGLILGLIGLPMLLLGGAGVLPIALGIILFIIGAIFSVMLYKKAEESEAK
jgi:transcription elongation factor Elf1